MGTEACSMTVTEIELEGIMFPSALTPPFSGKTLFLGGAGVRGLDINGEFKVFTVTGVYLESEAVNFLTKRWKGKPVEQLSSSNQFYRDIVTAPFDKLSQVTLVAHLSGSQFVQKVAENCRTFMKKENLYSQKEEKAAIEFEKLFEPIDLPPGSTIFFTHCSSGQLKVTFSKDTSVPELENGVIDCPILEEAVLESIVGENGVSPAAKLSLALRIHDIINSV
ncbi:Chalcone-flavonone isomerase family protein [Rhynchospora pubera]|uniref:Chalcone-flavonone isomerase family protein n=1 Tax=Rhynchospora pubera TaxID=906938 RepID=A0AAV8DWW2_9POAL|nr:Chalcone-flavonone isomerase family protein [Rhynchospora pubera]